MKMQYELHNSKVYIELFDNNYRKLILFAKSLIGDKEEARDIVSESLIKLWAQRNQFENMAHLQVYFYTVIRNACIDFLRIDKFRTKVKEEIKLTGIFTENVIERKYQEAELIQLLYKRINRLPKRMKQVFMLTYLDGYSRAEVAEKLKLSENTIRNTNVAAMKALKISFGQI